ncbi:hypothetical protein EVAR_44622_1 [Eumeta japonica]|uniref:Uncharacterized protein n=1 Tax=Eumeta variegata TaxID=151549 RepID=A0A4C1Z0K2_EUMVA|nr:hypothetical protein EVAR_44622_1 [Eumeta japonica]
MGAKLVENKTHTYLSCLGKLAAGFWQINGDTVWTVYFLHWRKRLNGSEADAEIRQLLHPFYEQYIEVQYVSPRPPLALGHFCIRAEMATLMQEVSLQDFRMLRSKIVDTRVYRGVNVGTDHFLGVCRIKDLYQCWRYHTKMVTAELEGTKVGKLHNQNVKDEYVERLKDSFSEIKLYEYLELDELWKVTKSVSVDEAKKVCGVNNRINVSKKDNEW